MTPTKKTIALAEFVEKGVDTDLLREMIRYLAQRMLEMDVECLCQAAYGERTADRGHSCNGYRDRLLQRRFMQLEGMQPLVDNQPARLSAIVS
jgi:putative transposase